MIDYTLAKELKDAGFEFRKVHTVPKDIINAYMVATTGFAAEGLVVFKDEPTFYHLPTLEELIEACRKFNHDWDVIIYSLRDGQYFAEAKEFGWVKKIVQGQTVLEAAARLWLALHPKQA